MTGVQVQVCTEGKTSSLRAAEAVSAHLYSLSSVCHRISHNGNIKKKKGKKDKPLSCSAYFLSLL